VPTTGAFPLSGSLDSIGPLARSIADCADADAIMAGEARWTLDAAPLSGLRVAVATGAPADNLDETVGKRFAEALDHLKKAGARLSDEPVPLVGDMTTLLSRTSILVAEAYHIHRDRLARRGADIDPIIVGRTQRGSEITAADYIDALQRRATMIRGMDARLADADVLVMPTTPIVAPRIDEVAEPKVFMATNAMILRNTTIVNFFDGCAASLPLPREGGLPVGLMVIARNGHDRRLLRIAAAIESLFS
jgi:aspartyl-tRNA(Asn)/glutamyl-tRNA(Gln) amidotransferase subunit A